MQWNRFCFIFFLSLVAIGSCQSAFAWQGRVVSVADGDSLVVRRGRKIIRIRLYGIDAPEYGQPYWQKAKGFVVTSSRGQQVDIEQKDIDRYGRVVALVTCRNQSLNAELLRQGLAWFSSKYCLSQPICEQWYRVQQDAKREGRGLWQQKNPLPPWQWKRLHRRKKEHLYRRGR